MLIRNRFTGAVIREIEGETLSGADLHGANLYGANLYGADLRGANLCCANLCCANLYGADLHGANLHGANLHGANLYGAKINWQSHDLLAEILRQAAGDGVARRQLAGLILISREWCWDQFLALDVAEKEWALDTLAACVTDGDHAPDVLRERAGVTW